MDSQFWFKISKLCLKREESHSFSPVIVYKSKLACKVLFDIFEIKNHTNWNWL